MNEQDVNSASKLMKLRGELQRLLYTLNGEDDSLVVDADVELRFTGTYPSAPDAFKFTEGKAYVSKSSAMLAINHDLTKIEKELEALGVKQ